MNKLLWIPLVVIIITLFACQQKEESIEPVAQSMDLTLNAAMSQLSQGEVFAGIESLLDAVLLTNPKEYVSSDFERKIRAAKSEIQNEDLSSVLDHVHEARVLLDSREIELEINMESESASVAEAVKTLVTDAKDLFQTGKALEGVASILDALLLFRPL